MCLLTCVNKHQSIQQDNHDIYLAKCTTGRRDLAAAWKINGKAPISFMPSFTHLCLLFIISGTAQRKFYNDHPPFNKWCSVHERKKWKWSCAPPARKRACKQTIHTLEALMLPTGLSQQDSVNFFVQKQRVIVSLILTMWGSRIKVRKCYQETYLGNEDFNRYLCTELLHSSSFSLHLISRVGNNLPARCFETQGDETGWLLQKMANEN